jgi:hypothetical protein
MRRFQYRDGNITDFGTMHKLYTGFKHTLAPTENACLRIHRAMHMRVGRHGIKSGPQYYAQNTVVYDFA